MSDTAQNLNSNVNDIWSVPDSTQNPNDDLNQAPTQKPSGRSFGKPGLAGGGESGGFLGSTREQGITQGDEHQQEQPRSDEVARGKESMPSDEILKSPEVGEKLKPAEARKPTEEKIKEPQVAQPEEVLVKGEIVDQRTGKVKTHRVAETADKTTKVADIKEQEFIEGVEQVHSII